MKINAKTNRGFQWSLLLILGLSTQLFLFSYEKEIKNISQELAKKIEEAGKKSVAIVDFNDLQGNVMELGRFLSEELSVAISISGKGFEVVDRLHLKALLKEHKLSFTGLINKKSTQKLGQIAGVDAVITGTITPFGDSVRVTVKILDINTAKLIGAVTANIPKTKPSRNYWKGASVTDFKWIQVVQLLLLILLGEKALRWMVLYLSRVYAGGKEVTSFVQYLLLIMEAKTEK